MLNAETVVAHLEQLRTLTADHSGAQRLAWSPMWMQARGWFRDKLAGLPAHWNIEQHFDAAGNHWTTLPGDSDRALVLGSHLDSVPNGGWLDGCLGVLAGLEVLTSIATQYNGRPPCTVRLVDWADEEGARFGRSLFGSSAFAGTHTIAADRNRTDRDGTTLEQALAACGISIDGIGDATREQQGIAAYLELHIEQGPVLEAAKKPLGVVQGTKGVERWAITFHGQEAHSGSTPMAVRRDALAACARLALAIKPIAMQHPQSVATMGSVKTFPGIVTAVVGRCEATLDLRDLDATVLSTMLHDCRQASERFAAQEGCTVTWQKIWSIEPIAFHPALIGICTDAVQQTCGTTELLPSGPLHDAAEVARTGIPTAMLFVQSIAGLSHNAAEDTDRAHLLLAVQALGLAAERTMQWIAQGETSA